MEDMELEPYGPTWTGGYLLSDVPGAGQQHRDGRGTWLWVQKWDLTHCPHSIFTVRPLPGRSHGHPYPCSTNHMGPRQGLLFYRSAWCELIRSLCHAYTNRHSRCQLQFQISFIPRLLLDPCHRPIWLWIWLSPLHGLLSRAGRGSVTSANSQPRWIPTQVSSRQKADRTDLRVDANHRSLAAELGFHDSLQQTRLSHDLRLSVTISITIVSHQRCHVERSLGIQALLLSSKRATHQRPLAQLCVASKVSSHASRHGTTSPYAI